MIVMVCASVIATVLVIHLSAISQPVPPWVNTLFLKIIPRLMCLSVEPGPATVLANRGKEYIDEQSKHLGAAQNGIMINANQKSDPEVYPPHQNSSKDLQELVSAFNYLKADTERKNAESLEQAQWRRVSIVVDRILLYIFSIFAIVCTVFLTTQVVVGSSNDYKREMREFEEEW